MIAPRTYKMGRGYGDRAKTAHLTVPAFLLREMPEGDLYFELHVTEEGLLYKPVSKPDDAAPEVDDLPAWVVEGARST